MVYKTISRCMTFNPNQFVYDKIELRDDFPQDKPDLECFKEITERIEAMAKMAYPWLFQDRFQEIMSPAAEVTKPETWGVDAVVKKYGGYIPKPEKKTTNATEFYCDGIRASKNIGELRTWKVMAESNPTLKAVYDEVFNQLTKTETV